MDIYYTWIDITDDWSVTDWRQTLEVVERKQSSNSIALIFFLFLDFQIKTDIKW